MARIGLYPGTFDPITNGHCDIIERAAALVDQLIIGVAVGSAKKPLFSIEERVALIEEAVKPIKDCEISVCPFDNLLMHFATDVGAQIIIRGLRAVADFEYEFQLVNMNRHLNAQIDTVFLMADPHHQAVASRLVKEIAQLGGRIETFIPGHVVRPLYAKYS